VKSFIICGTNFRPHHLWIFLPILPFLSLPLYQICTSTTTTTINLHHVSSSTLYQSPSSLHTNQVCYGAIKYEPNFNRISTDLWPCKTASTRATTNGKDESAKILCLYLCCHLHSTKDSIISGEFNQFRESG
jgi:hypothetical protein